jgi:hypothetical protein
VPQAKGQNTKHEMYWESNVQRSTSNSELGLGLGLGLGVLSFKPAPGSSSFKSQKQFKQPSPFPEQAPGCLYGIHHTEYRILHFAALPYLRSSNALRAVEQHTTTNAHNGQHTAHQ